MHLSNNISPCNQNMAYSKTPLKRCNRSKNTLKCSPTNISIITNNSTRINSLILIIMSIPLMSLILIKCRKSFTSNPSLQPLKLTRKNNKIKLNSKKTITQAPKKWRNTLNKATFIEDPPLTPTQILIFMNKNNKFKHWMKK